MITCNDINHFFTTYRENLKKSFQWNDRIFSSASKEEWLASMKCRAVAMNDIFMENQSMIEQVLYPILENPEFLSKEEIDLVLTWLKKMYYGEYDEPFFLRLICLALIPHYERINAMEDLLFLYVCAGYTHIEISRTVEPEAGKQAVYYYKKVISYKDEITNFVNPLSRDYIFIAYANLIRVSPIMGALSLEEAYDLLNELIALRKQEKFCQYDETNPRIPLLVQNTISSFYNCPPLLDIAGLYPDSPIRKILSEQVKKYYPECLAEKGSIYNCDNDLVFHYYLVMAREELISWDKAWMILDDYYLHQLKYLHKNVNVDKNTIYFNQPLYLMEALGKSSIPQDLKQAKYKFYRDTSANYVKLCPSGFNSYDLNYAIQRFVFNPLLLESFSDRKERENYIYNMIVCRHINTFTHSVMVAKITDVLLSYILSHKPEILAGFSPYIQTRDDVLLYKNEIFDYIHRAALLHDIGKNALTDIINTQHRKISDYAFSIIKKHPEKGAEYLSRHKDFRMYQDVALGHHITYDGMGGYPPSFDKNSSPFQAAIDIIRISDCLDAATDTLSRYYHKPKAFEEIMDEFREGSGTQYNPEMIQLIFDYPDLYTALKLMTGEHREDIYYEIYQTFIHRN
ncbi:MAG: HD-GYP domain-containing protein [Roseburia sp.]